MSPNSRASSVEERPGEDSADPDWDEEADNSIGGRKEGGDDDPEYDPETKQKSKPLKWKKMLAQHSVRQLS